MKLMHIDSCSELPKNTFMILYHAPFFAMVKEEGQTEEEHGLICSIFEYRAKYGEPGTVYILRSWIFIVKEE